MRMLPKSAILLLIFCITATTMAGCQTEIKASAISDTLPPVLDRHDAYVETGLEGDEKAQALLESAAVRQTYEANVDGYMPAGIAPSVVKVLDRHDGFVSQDSTLAELNKEIYLDSSAALRLLFYPEE